MRTTSTTVVAFGLTAVLSLGVAQRGHAWPFQLDRHGERDIVDGVRVGPGGEVYVNGTVAEWGEIIRLDPATGATLWRYIFHREPDLFFYDTLRGLAIDATGGVFGAGSSNFDFDAVRVDPVTGQEIWHTIINSTSNTSYDYAKAIAADGFGGVMVGGGIQDQDGVFGPDFAVVRLDAATGAVLWKSTIDGGASTAVAARGEEAAAVAIASNGDAIAVGFITVRLPGDVMDDRLIAAARFARDDGHEIWRWTYRPSPLFLGENFGRHVALDAAGDVIVSGRHGFTGGRGGTAAVFKLAGATGTELWRYVNSDEDTNGVAVDGAGDVLVAASSIHEGFPMFPRHHDFTVLKLSGGTGAVLWRQQVPGGGSVAQQVAVDAAQDVIAVGSHRGAVSAMKLAGSDGHVLWTRESNPRPGVSSYWADVALDGSGRVFAGGITSGPPQYAPEDLYVAAFDELTGAGIGCGNGTLDTGETCDDGNSADFDGCSATCTVETCSDGVVDLDEQCDDGAHVAGDGCDAQCSYEGCGDGEVGAGEQCDDGNRTAGDICSPTCQFEICETPNVASASRISLKRLGGVPGDERIALRMEVTSTTGIPVGMQLIVEDLGAGGSLVFDLSYRTNAVGGITNQPGCDPRKDFFRPGSRGDTYRNGTNTLPPSCAPGSAQGFSKMTVKRVTSRPGQYLIKAAFKNSSLPTPVGPLRVSLVGGANVQSLFPGTCWQSAFTAAQCVAGPSSIGCR